MSDPILVKHARATYPVYVDPGIGAHLNERIRELLPGRRVAAITDIAVHDLLQQGKLGQLTWTGEMLTVPAGESSKSRENWAHLSDELLAREFGRDSALCGMGGGVVGDLTGFVAATYMRGLPYILVPTTLLAMLDASVGGKTGINVPEGKNLIGAFHPPAGVIADPETLATLPEREYRSGMAEAVKHGLIADATYFTWIETHADALHRRDPIAIAALVRRSVEIKAAVVNEDELETGRRAILNAGHTVAHALEQTSGYELTHGEAVALGLIAECEIAERIGVASEGLHVRVAQLLGRLGLPTQLRDEVSRQSLLRRMAMDKKNRGRRIHMALPTRLGEIHREGEQWTTAVTAEDIALGLMAVSPPQEPTQTHN
ncbi:MAG TPA: 3-dehydroquinate synthase [Gemmatimonadales bacterium]|nr:3-dehydroquinate synthase [Gemmatimonadales bacterium]